MAKLRIDKQFIVKAVHLVRKGYFIKTVCQALLIDESTWYKWLKLGEETTDKRSPYVNFFQSIKKAEAEAEMIALKNIKKAGKQDWKADAWYLERRFNDQWGRRETLINELKGGVSITDGMEAELINDPKGRELLKELYRIRATKHKKELDESRQD